MIIVSLSTLLNCGDSSEDPGIDCSTSDLSLEVVESVKSDCDAPGSVTLEATGGLEEYSYSVDGITFQQSPVFGNLFAGNFTFTVKDQNQCTAEVTFTLESEPTGITLSLSGTTSDCTNETGSITANASGGVGTLQFSLNGGAFDTSNQFEDLGTGDYAVTVIDEEGCRVTKTFKVLSNTSLTADVMPIIAKDCAISGCHNGSQSPRLTSKSEVIANAARIKSETQAGSMPRDRTLTQTEIDLIACWVDDGANDN